MPAPTLIALAMTAALVLAVFATAAMSRPTGTRGTGALSSYAKRRDAQARAQRAATNTVAE